MRRIFPLAVCLVLAWTVPATALNTEPWQTDNGDQGEPCAGDGDHGGHSYPTQSCVMAVNPHYATVMGGGDTCVNRSLRCASCFECCRLQHAEADTCHCNSSFCRTKQDYTEQKCRENCFGTYEDDCPGAP